MSVPCTFMVNILHHSNSKSHNIDNGGLTNIYGGMELSRFLDNGSCSTMTMELYGPDHVLYFFINNDTIVDTRVEHLEDFDHTLFGDMAITLYPLGV